MCWLSHDREGRGEKHDDFDLTPLKASSVVSGAALLSKRGNGADEGNGRHPEPVQWDICFSLWFV